MGARWSYGSRRKLQQLTPSLRSIVGKVRDKRDISIITAHRGEAEQNAAYKEGMSKIKWPLGKHNSYPSRAVDVQPYPYNEVSLREDLSYIAGLFIAFGESEGVHIRWGGDWDHDGETADNEWDDLFHFEIQGDK